MVLQNLLHESAVAGYLCKNPIALIELVISTVNFWQKFKERNAVKLKCNRYFEYIKLRKTFDVPNPWSLLIVPCSYFND